MNIIITIPEPNRLFSLYAMGKLKSVVRLQDKSFVTLDDDYVISLFYRLGKHRHVYICASPRILPGVPTRNFSGVDKPLAVLSELTGRSFDRYKRALYLLSSNAKSKDSFSKMQISSFWNIAQLCALGKNSLQNLMRVVELDSGKKL